MKKLLLFLLIFGFGFVLVACGNDDEDDKKKNWPETNPNETALAEGFTSLENQNRNGEIDEEGYYTVGDVRIKTTDVYRTFYPTEVQDSKFNYLINTWTYNSRHYTNMVDGLLENDKYGNLVGALAVGYKIEENSDGTETWTFQLKEGAYWVDNASGDVYDEVVADDFVAGIEYVLDPINGSGTAGIVMGLIDNAKEYYEAYADENVDDLDFETVGVKALSKYQVAYTLVEPTPYFLSSLTYSPFLPVNRQFVQEQGTDFGATANNILVNGAFRITEHVSGNKMTYTKNERYYDKAHVYVNKVEYRFAPGTATNADIRSWYEAGEIDGFTVNANDKEGYAKYVLGEDETGTIQNPASSEANGVLQIGDATYIGYFNFVRETYEYTNTDYAKNAAQKAATSKALLNVDFRKGFLYGLNVIEQLKWWNEGEPWQWLMRGYTNKELVVHEGKDYTEYLNDVFNEKQGTTGVDLAGINQKGDPIYSVDKATEYFKTAKAALIDGGLTEADFPIQIDVIGDMNPEIRAFEEEMYKSLNAIKDENGKAIIKININVPATDEQNTDWGSVTNNYDFSLWSGWGPDYADPKTFLNTMAIGGDMVEQLGFTQKDQANIDLEKAVLGEYDKLYREAAAITDVDKLDERYQKMAEAEYALIYEYAIIIPWLTQSGYAPVVSKVIPYHVGKATYGLTSDKLKNVIVSETAITKDIRAAVKADYEANK